MPRPIHRKADPEAQEAFKKGPPRESRRSPRPAPRERVEVWFADEARFGRQGTLTRVWARRGSRPRGVRQTEYDWCYVMTAVCPATGQAAGLIMPCMNMATVNDFLAELSLRLAPGVHAVLIWDNAGFHTGKVGGRPAEHHAAAAAAVLAGAEPGGEPLALPAEPLLVAASVQGLRGVEGGGGGRLAGGLPGARSWSDRSAPPRTSTYELNRRVPYYQVGHSQLHRTRKRALNKYLLGWSTEPMFLSLTILITSSSLR